jgi:hypothetical protein
VSTGDVAERRDHDGDRQAVGGGNAKQAGSARAVQELVGADGTSAEEDQGESADEFGYEFLRDGVHRDPPRREGDAPRGRRGL